ncbi:MAG TPA: MlaD family protein, partial [Chthoniobacterales bacterium]|nr:MlaD family protein [Chthoniobacterales bacterium]
MQLRRNEITTGLLVLATVGILAFILILLGAPGLFRPLVVYKLYFDNAAGIKLGAPVLLAGRKVGQVKLLNSPVSREEAAGALEAAGNLGTLNEPAGTLPHFEVRIDVEVDRTALVYKNANVRLMTLGLLGDTAIDISGGNDHSGKSEDGQVFAGNRVPDFSEAVAKMLGIIQPVATQATATMKELQNTVTNL